MIFLTQLSTEEQEAGLDALGIPSEDPETGWNLTFEQRLHLFEMQLKAMEQDMKKVVVWPEIEA